MKPNVDDLIITHDQMRAKLYGVLILKPLSVTTLELSSTEC
jgi:hypothetical protein